MTARKHTISHHARQRMESLGIPESDVVDTLRAPLVTMPGGGGHDPNRVIYVGRRVRLVLDGGAGDVITVQLRSRSPYTHGVHHLENHPDHPRAAA